MTKGEKVWVFLRTRQSFSNIEKHRQGVSRAAVKRAGTCTPYNAEVGGLVVCAGRQSLLLHFVAALAQSSRGGVPDVSRHHFPPYRASASVLHLRCDLCRTTSWPTLTTRTVSFPYHRLQHRNLPSTSADIGTGRRTKTKRKAGQSRSGWECRRPSRLPTAAARLNPTMLKW